ncbi:MAG: hypothetical protein Q9208_003232 [Pyrenodesmia sp. 3 TL-2023]
MSFKHSNGSGFPERASAGNHSEHGESRTDIPGDRRVNQPQAQTSLGFINKGNSCYLNSVIIALLHVPKFTNWLEQTHAACELKNCVACALRKLSLAYWDVSREFAVVTRALREFESVISKASPKPWSMKKQKRQQDAPEFYTWLLNTVDAQLQLCDKKGLSDHFDLHARETSKCLTCSDEWSREVSENQLVIPAGVNANLDQAISERFQGEELPNIECDSEQCKPSGRAKGERVTKKRTSKISRGPDILCVQLSRSVGNTEGNGGKFSAEKSMRDVAFAETLDLTPHVANTYPLSYQLRAVVHHRGDTQGGHYVSFTKTPQGNWERQDNENVTKATAEQAIKPKGRFTPYLLFWEKVEPKERTETYPESKKRSHDEIADASEADSGRPRSKSPKTDKAAVDSSGGKSESIWRLEWLYGSHQTKLAEELARCRKEHDDKDAIIRKQKEQIEQAELTNSELRATCDKLRYALEAWKQATAEISPMMQHIEAYGGRNSHKASAYLRLKATAEDHETASAGLPDLHERESTAGLLQGAKGGSPRRS